jgi:hypothetical protein
MVKAVSPDRGDGAMGQNHWAPGDANVRGVGYG